LDNVGLIHLNGRVYDPSIGRFISADPTVPDPLYSQSFNRYAYVYNNPMTYIDPSGLDPADLIILTPPLNSNQALAVAATVLLFTGAGAAVDVIAFLGSDAVIATIGPTVASGAQLIAAAGYSANGVAVAVNDVNAFSPADAAANPDTTALDYTQLVTDAPYATAGEPAAIAAFLIDLNKLNPKAQQPTPPEKPAPTNQSSSGGSSQGGSSISAGGGYNPFSNVPVINGNSTPGTGDQTLCEMAGCNVTVGQPTTTPQPPPPPSPPPPPQCMDGSGKVIPCPQ